MTFNCFTHHHHFHSRLELRLPWVAVVIGHSNGSVALLVVVVPAVIHCFAGARKEVAHCSLRRGCWLRQRAHHGTVAADPRLAFVFCSTGLTKNFICSFPTHGNRGRSGRVAQLATPHSRDPERYVPHGVEIHGMAWHGMVEVCEGAPVAVSGWVLADRHDLRPCAASSLHRGTMSVSDVIGGTGTSA